MFEKYKVRPGTIPVQSTLIDSGLVGCKVFFIHQIRPVVSGEVSRGEKMLYSGTDPESYITEYTVVYEDNFWLCLILVDRLFSC